mgnify:CR=1 FL=1
MKDSGLSLPELEKIPSHTHPRHVNMSSFRLPRRRKMASSELQLPESSSRDPEALDMIRKSVETILEAEVGHVDLMDWSEFLDRLDDFAFTKTKGLIGPEGDW